MARISRARPASPRAALGALLKEILLRRGFRVGELDNREPVRSYFTFAYERPDHPRLRELKRRYGLGALVSGARNDMEKALRVLGRGREQYPADWRFPFYMGFTHYFSLGDGMAGGRAMAEAARLPGSPAYLPGLASRMLSEAREPEVALALLAPIVRQESDPARRAVLSRRIREVTVERDLQVLERAVERYREKTGAVPENLTELVREGILEGIPPEPNGGSYVIDRGGKVRSDRVAQRLMVFQQR